MNTKHSWFRTLSGFLLLALALGAMGGIPTRAAQDLPESAPPAGLSSDDWGQIQALLSSVLPFPQAYLKASNTGMADYFGFSVAISGETVVVGAEYEASSAQGVNGNQNDNTAADAGAAYVFVRSGTTWTQQAYLKASNTDGGDEFGTAVAISGDTIVVGAYNEDSNANGVNGIQGNNSAVDSGAAYVFTRSGTTWSQQAYLKASNTEAFDAFGWSVAIVGDIVVVGAYGEDSFASGVNGNQSDNSAAYAGAAYVFARSGTDWSQQAYLKASNTEAGDNFGHTVAVSSNTVVVGAPLEDSNSSGVNGIQNNNLAVDSGAAYVFTRSGTAWTQQAYVKASNTGAGDLFGYSVTIFANTAVVGAQYEDSNATGVNGDPNNDLALDSGAVYVFTRSGTTWSQQAYLKASNTGMEDYFGYSVAIAWDTVAVGAYGEDSNATGLNGDQANNSAADGGAAYVFTRSGTTWSQEAYVKASNTDAYDSFGCSVAVSGDTVISGAYGESSSATGVNGNKDDNSASNSGAAYVFEQKYTDTFRSVGAYDGWILELFEPTGQGGSSNNKDTTFRLGDEVGDKQYRAVLSFNTSTLPDTAAIAKVTLKIRKQGQVGTDPFTILGALRVDIRKPFFGTSVGLAVSDFQAFASKFDVGKFIKTPVNNWYTAVIGSTAYPYINLTGTTQFRLYFPLDDNDDGNADYVKFFSGDYGTVRLRPTLIIEYYVP